MDDPRPTSNVPFHFHGAAGVASVGLAGSWGDWVPVPMTRHDGDGGLWTTVVALPPGEVRFKFVVDGDWVAAGDYGVESDGHGGENCVRLIEEAAESESGSEGGTDEVVGEKAGETDEGERQVEVDGGEDEGEASSHFVVEKAVAKEEEPGFRIESKVLEQTSKVLGSGNEGCVVM